MLAAVLSSLLLLASACDSEPTTQRGEASPSPTRQTDLPNETPEGSTHEPGVDIYAAVIRRLVTKDHTFGAGSSPFERVFVIDGPIRNAGDPMNGPEAFGPSPKPFSEDVVEGITRELKDLPPIEFVSNANEARFGEDGMGGVKGQGVIVALGPIEREPGKVHVQNMLWCGGLCGQWLTYVLKQSEDDWRITGTTGPAAIS